MKVPVFSTSTATNPLSNYVHSTIHNLTLLCNGSFQLSLYNSQQQPSVPSQDSMAQLTISIDLILCFLQYLLLSLSLFYFEINYVCMYRSLLGLRSNLMIEQGVNTST